jgi:hypothetical protein
VRGNVSGRQWSVVIFCLLMMLLWSVPVEAASMLKEYRTRSGQVKVMSEGRVRTIVLGEDVLYRGTDFLGISRVFSTDAYDALLVKDFSGPIYCPVRYVLISFFKNGLHLITPPFGHCSDKPNIRRKGTDITISFRAFGSKPAETWLFDGRNLKRQE